MSRSHACVVAKEKDVIPANSSSAKSHAPLLAEVTRLAVSAGAHGGLGFARCSRKRLPLCLFGEEVLCGRVIRRAGAVACGTRRPDVVTGYSIMLVHSTSRYHSAFRLALDGRSLETATSCGTLRRAGGGEFGSVEALANRRQLANKRVPAHKTQVIRVTICLPTSSTRRFRKGHYDLRKWKRNRGVMGSLPNGDIRFPKMTNAPGSSTVPVSPQRVTEE